MQNLLSPVLLALHLMLAIALVGVVLLQRSEGGLGGLGGGGMSGFMTSRGSTNLLTKTTRWLAAGFMATSLVLAWLASHSHAPPLLVVPPATQTPIAPLTDQSLPSTNQANTPTAPSSSPSSGSGNAIPTTPAAPTVPTNQ